MLLCAVILGRYYTDHHDVDEDLTAIIGLGGACQDNIQAGITRRSVNDSSSYSSINIASMCRHLWRTLNYTDTHDVDENETTIVGCGGRSHGTAAGVVLREMIRDSSHISDAVASIQNFISLIVL